jgi:hypothetical protein
MSIEGNGALKEQLAQLRMQYINELENTEAEGVREKTRRRIAYALLGTLLVVMVGSLLYIVGLSLFGTLTTDTLIPIVQTVGATLLAPLVGLVGAVTGFYYGGQTAVQAATQGAQATRAATRAATEAAEAATQALSSAPPETNVTFGGETFEPREFADILVGEVIPDLRQRVDQTSDVTWEDVSEERDVEAEALVEATRVLVPPPYAVARPALTYGILMGMVAVRAASLAGELSSPSNRYASARGWVCDNFYELIFWNCHNR